QRFAAAGGHEHESIPAVNDGVDDFILGWAVGIVTEDVPQNIQRLFHGLRV
ncbi:MAG: hypothetical protein JKY98_12055, partial [Gammaproteobacteria bacterium]|nr:hypothetical protein [Gammaproteobacteria bacterium]